ncbi:hypothetical protein [Lederbergia citri]|uniref:Uncharacterized protein n=1 Tax=Lederbergia citri TaxID=2833580 RepID=A0A942TFC5_9BACI|nr:hypothetical protein [Lederbergia citri]MBS4195384.1 hypothetical protein [Lederbergia citri]
MAQHNEITFGDLILVEGYGDEPFFVDSWSVETHYTPDETWTETWYDVVSAHTGAYSMAELNDITRICGAEAADDYLKSHADIPIENITKEVGSMFGYEPKNRKPSRNPELDRQRAKAKKDSEIDRLLTELGDYMALYRTFGDAEYGRKVDEVKRKLAEVASAE